MKKSFRIIIILCLVLVSFNVSRSQDDVYLKAISGGIKKINLAVFDLLDRNESEAEPDISRNMTSILKNDLRLSGVFSLIPAPKINSVRGLGDSLDYILLDNRGTEYLLKGTFTKDNKTIEIVIDLQHVKSRQAIIRNEQYKIDEENLRWGIHKISDDIVYHLTGEQGIAQTKIVFVSLRTGFKEIYTMDYDGANTRQITSDNALKFAPKWSPDGRYIVYSTVKDGLPDLYIIDLVTKEISSLSSREGGDLSPNWSPDGKYIAYAMSFAEIGNQEIYISKPDGSELRQLTDNPFMDISPTFSPSGKEIAFNSTRTGQPQIYIMNSDGTNVRRLTYYGGYNTSPSWSPKGDRIAFINLDVDNDFDVLTTDVAGENIFQLTDFSGDNEDPSWSPDGLHITFSSTRGGLPEIYIMNWDGSDQTRITSGGKNLQPNWSARLKNNSIK